MRKLERERENNTKNTEGDAIIFQLNATLFTDYCILQKAASLIICSHYYYIYMYVYITVFTIKRILLQALFTSGPVPH